MNNNGIKTASVILLALGCVFLALGLSSVVWTAAGIGSGRRETAYKEKIEYLVVKPEEAVRLGDTYEGVPAMDGYAFYELHFSVKNEGSEKSYRVLPYLYYEGEEYDDVRDYWTTEEDTTEEVLEEPLFSGYDEPFLPPYRRGSASQVVQIQDGVKSFYVSYAPNYESDDVVFEMSVE